MADSLGQELERRYEAALRRAEAAQTELREAMKDLERLETARAVVRELSGSASAASSLGTLTKGQSAIYEVLPSGKEQGLSPVQVYELCKQDGARLHVDYVRTTLWRLAQNGVIKSADGKYWK